MGRKKINIFQSAGNGTEFSGRLFRDIWAGKIQNKEVHGPVEGFLLPLRDLAAEGRVVAAPNANFETLHPTAADIAKAEQLGAIR